MHARRQTNPADGQYKSAGGAIVSIMSVGSGSLLRTNLANGRATCGVHMPRFKLALGLVLLAGVLVAVAIAILNPFWASHTVNEPERAAIDRGRTGEDAASRERKSTAKATGSDSIIRDLVESPGQMNPIETNSPRMQQKQIKMH